MLVAGISLFISFLFGSVEQTELLIPQLKNEIHTQISDKERQKELLELIIQFEQEIKNDRIQLLKKSKQLKTLSFDRVSPIDTLLLLLNSSLDIWIKIHDKGIIYRLQLSELLTEKEWNSIVSAFLPELSKKEDIAIETLKNLIIGETGEIEKYFAKYIKDPFRLTEIDKAFNNFNNYIVITTHENIEMIVHNNTTLRNQKATKEELFEIVSSMEGMRLQFFDELAELHYNISEFTTNPEWYKVIRKINRKY